MKINDLVFEAHSNAIEKGWYKQARNVPELLCLIHSEISEALESYRNSEPYVFYQKDGKPDGLVVELADAVIRIADMIGFINEVDEIDFEKIIIDKMNFNKTRPERHGGKIA